MEIKKRVLAIQGSFRENGLTTTMLKRLQNESVRDSMAVG